MNDVLLSHLAAVTPEEQHILSGHQPDKAFYAAGKNFIIDGDTMLAGRLLQVRTHTRFAAFPDHSHDYVEMVYMCRGHTEHVIDDSYPLVLEKGEILMLGPGVFHRIAPAKAEDIAVNIMVRPEFFSRTMGWMQTENVLRSFLVDVLRTNGESARVLHFRVADVPPVQNLVENLIWNTLYAEPDDALMSMTLGLLFTQLLKYTDRLRIGEKERTESTHTMAALRYIEDHFRCARLSELAESLHLPLYTLSRTIKNETGLTFKELLLQKRFNCAVELLRETDLPVSAVISAVGYENTSYFYRRFHAEYHLSPQEYRKQYHEASEQNGASAGRFSPGRTK